MRWPDDFLGDVVAPVICLLGFAVMVIGGLGVLWRLGLFLFVTR